VYGALSAAVQAPLVLFFEYERELFHVAFGYSNSAAPRRDPCELLTCTTAEPASTLIRALFTLRARLDTKIFYFFFAQRIHAEKYHILSAKKNVSLLFFF